MSSFRTVHLPSAVGQFSQSTRVSVEQFPYFDSPKHNFGNGFKAPHPKDFMTSQELPFIRANLGDKSGISYSKDFSVDWSKWAGLRATTVIRICGERFQRSSLSPITHFHLFLYKLGTTFPDLILREFFPYQCCMIQLILCATQAWTYSDWACVHLSLDRYYWDTAKCTLSQTPCTDFILAVKCNKQLRHDNK